MNTLETVLCHCGAFGLPLAVEDVVPPKSGIQIFTFLPAPWKNDTW